MLLLWFLVGCDDQDDKQRAIINEGIDFSGEGNVIYSFWNGENQCSNTQNITLNTGPKKTAVMRVKGKSFVYGKNGCQESSEVEFVFSRNLQRVEFG